MNALLVAAWALASAPPDPADVKPGWLALVIVALIGLATFLLWRSMNHQLKKVHFENDGAERDDTAREGNGGATAP